QIEVLFNAAGMDVGDYYADIIIENTVPGNSEVKISAHMQVAAGSGIEEAKIPKVFFVKQNYPNPFNTETIIKYGCPEKTKVCIHVFDVTGRIVHTLINKEVEAGYYEVKWDGTNKFGKKISNSVYFYRIQAGDFTATKKMIFLR
ncbi:MAG: T9SS type A sorting domain-containing protein, partial [candidate division WOR-3 bacterium]